MKTFVRTLDAMVATLLVTAVLGVVALMKFGIINVDRVQETHRIETYVDGKLESSTKSVNFLGYDISIDYHNELNLR